FDNYIADIDPRAEANALILWIIDRQVIHTALELNGSPNGFDSTWKLRQEPVPGVLDNAAAVYGDRGRDTVHEERGQFGVRCLFIMVHQPRVASHVGSQYRRQPALDPVWRLLRHGSQIPPIGYCTTDQTTAPNAVLPVTAHAASDIGTPLGNRLSRDYRSQLSSKVLDWFSHQLG